MSRMTRSKSNTKPHRQRHHLKLFAASNTHAHTRAHHKLFPISRNSLGEQHRDFTLFFFFLFFTSLERLSADVRHVRESYTNSKNSTMTNVDTSVNGDNVVGCHEKRPYNMKNEKKKKKKMRIKIRVNNDIILKKNCFFFH